MAREAGVRYQTVDGAWFKKRVTEGSHQGVLLDCHEQAMADESDLKARVAEVGAQALFLVLDEIADPRNFGACLRSANAAGCHGVIFPKRNSAPLSAVAQKAAQGGTEGLPLYAVGNLARCLDDLRQAGVWVVGTAADAPKAYTKYKATGPMAVVLGNEGKGLRRLTRDKCDELVNIPMFGTVESLNVSVATGILLFEFVRQRNG